MMGKLAPRRFHLRKPGCLALAARAVARRAVALHHLPEPLCHLLRTA